ncbi:MAG: diaminobutyrate--2-oxoglutarate transaminase [Solirubrobacterales bacterium]|nr:diaminobutyrate--2-oxoglutarate transaminase [Solirubrobacterales bacterium]
MKIFETLESEVRYYCRAWPVVFDRARGSWLHDEDGRSYLDFFAGAGALNYGHNNPALKEPVLRYLADDRVIQSLDMFTVAKREFLAAFDELVLRPRDLRYRVQFPGPGGANAVEAALRLAHKATGRNDYVCFRDGFHGMTLGSMSVSGNPQRRAACAGRVTLAHCLAFDQGTPDLAAEFAELDRALAGELGTGEPPAAVIVEAVQGDGGINVARTDWLRGLAVRCRDHDVPLILDDVQMGCGRTGAFFSFEEAGIRPDIVCLSKSIGGYGLPVALTLIRDELDVWEPGEHTGTFRGVTLGLVAGTAALRHYWADDRLQRSTLERGQHVAEMLAALRGAVDGTGIASRGRGLAHGLAFERPEIAHAVSRAAFEMRLLVETCGPDDGVVKLLPPLTITDDDLETGLGRLADAVLSAAGGKGAGSRIAASRSPSGGARRALQGCERSRAD